MHELTLRGTFGPGFTYVHMDVNVLLLIMHCTLTSSIVYIPWYLFIYHGFSLDIVWL